MTSTWPQRILPGSKRRYLDIWMPQYVYDQFKSNPVTLRFNMALTELQTTQVTRTTLSAHEFSVPGFGVCRAPVMGYGTLTCRSAFRQPQLTYASADWSQTPCSAPQTKVEEVRGGYWAGLFDSEPAEFGITPIVFSSVAFTSNLNNPTEGKYLCTGVPITFAQYKPVGRMQTTFTLPDFHLPEPR
jgi:hypothetical protein